MNRWCWLLLFFLGWSVAGLAFFNTKENQTPKKDLISQPNKIVALAPNLTEILFSLGLNEEIVGATTDSFYPPEAKDKFQVGSFWQPDIEAVIAANPDLVITLEFAQQKNIAQRLNRIGYKTVTVNIETINELFKAIDIIGTATSHKNEANMLIENINEKLGKISSRFDSAYKPKVLWVVQRQPLRIAGTDTFINEIISLAGGENAIGSTIYKYPPIGHEQIIAGQIDIIIEPAMTKNFMESQKETLQQYWGKYESIPAVKNNRIYVVDGDIVSQLGPRLPKGVELVAKCINSKFQLN